MSGLRLNIGSGQRPFDQSHGWINIDCISRPPDQVPDVICDVGADPLPYPDGSVGVCVLHQVYEHFGLGEGHGIIRECHRVLRKDGSLIVTVPDMRALAQRWLLGQLEDYLYMVNVYGAYQGQPGDRHKWGYHDVSLMKDLNAALGDLDRWTSVRPFDFRPIPGADIARDWWIIGMESVK